MKNFSSLTVRTLTVLAVVTALLFSIALLPSLFHSNAENQAASSETPKGSQERGFPNFDIRTQRDARSADDLARFRSSVGTDESLVSALRGEITKGEESLRARLPDIVVEYNDGLGEAEVISPNVWKDGAELLTQPSSDGRPTLLRDFLKDNARLVGLEPSQTDSLKVAADYTNPDGKPLRMFPGIALHLAPFVNGEVEICTKRSRQIPLNSSSRCKSDSSRRAVKFFIAETIALPGARC